MKWYKCARWAPVRHLFSLEGEWALDWKEEDKQQSKGNENQDRLRDTVIGKELKSLCLDRLHLSVQRKPAKESLTNT